MPDNLMPASQMSLETRVANSRFISSIAPASSVEEAKAFIKEISQRYSDASHNVPVYVIGFGSSVIAHASDNGEPSGTAGRPALAVLQGSGLGDTVLVITRYFGGTKLGTGGLVKAYGDSVRAIITQVPKAKKVIVHHGFLTCPFHLYEQVSRFIRKHNGVINNEQFSDHVDIHFFIPVNSFSHLENELTELSNGHLQIQIIKENQSVLIPLVPPSP